NTVMCWRLRRICHSGAGSRPAGAPGSAKRARTTVLWLTTAATRDAAASRGVKHTTLARERSTTATTIMTTASGTSSDGATAVLIANRIANQAAAVNDMAA